MNKKIKTLLCALMIMCVSICASFSVGCGELDQLICEHKYGKVTTIKAPTCSKKGKGEKVCELCGKVETVSIDCLTHRFIYMEAIEATCTQDGKESYIECRDCGFIEKSPALIPAIGHFVVTVKGFSATCTESGLTDGKHCSVCNEVLLEQIEIAPTGHRLVSVEEKLATCTETGHTAGEVCQDCGKGYKGFKELPKTGHRYDRWGICQYCGEYNDLYDDSCWTGIY